jgi:Icc-related predicted phosphoesterase
MKLAFYSDTHRKHDKVSFNNGDFLFYCGDLTSRGSISDVEKFAKHMATLDYKYKIAIAGNHDFCFENEQKLDAERIFKDYEIIYLNDSGITLEGLNIWGSPIQPWFHDWAFNRARGEDIRTHWELIPPNTDVLLTHGPPMGILDKCYHGARVGCEELLKKVLEVKPRIHAFGHIHEEYGILEQHGITFINACNLNESYKVINPIIEIEI